MGENMAYNGLNSRPGHVTNVKNFPLLCDKITKIRVILQNWRYKCSAWVLAGPHLTSRS